MRLLEGDRPEHFDKLEQVRAPNLQSRSSFLVPADFRLPLANPLGFPQLS
jgi:hypothetical protein